MKQTINWRYAAAGALCCIGLLAAVLAFSNFQSRTTIALPAPGPDDPMPLGLGLMSVEDAGVDAVVDQTAEALSRRVAEISLPQGEALVADVEGIMRCWLSGTADEYLAYLEGNGDKPPPVPLWDDPQRRSKEWLESTRALREASFDPSGTIIRTSYEHSELIADDSVSSVTTGWRFNKLSGYDEGYIDLEQVKVPGLVIREIRIPMRSKSLVHGVQFNGLLALSYAQDPSSSQWTLVAVSVYDLPLNDTARIPAF